ncbi:MAG: hypothetical protein J7502_16640 [Flavisolibacter sp.]|nr:hypothetical protein [Flavisolibacter sp.]
MKWEMVISIVALVFSGITVYISILYRRKDFYNQLIKEQISAGYNVMEILLRLNHSFNEGYKKYVGVPTAQHLIETGIEPNNEMIMAWQTNLFVNLESEYLNAFNSVLSRGFIFPADLQKELTNYFELLSDLFEKKNDENLGLALSELYNPLANITDKLNYYFKIDKLSKQLNKLL